MNEGNEFHIKYLDDLEKRLELTLWLPTRCNVIAIQKWDLTNCGNSDIVLWKDDHSFPLLDLKKYSEDELEKETIRCDNDKQFYTDYGNLEEDGIMWRYSLDITGAMNDVFDTVLEKLSGKNIEKKSEVVTDYIHTLEQQCTVISSRLFSSQSLMSEGIVNNSSIDECIVRIAACLSENGCVIALVSDAQWRDLVGQPQNSFLDSGVRILQIIGLSNENVVLNDFAHEKGREIKIAKKDFCCLAGELLEVYK